MYPFLLQYKKYIFLSLLIIFCITDCKKYPDGPLISFLSKQRRVRGEWQVESFTVNGADSTSQLSCNDYFFGPGSGDERQFVNYGVCSYVGSFAGTWRFTNSKKDLTINGNPNATGKTPFITLSSVDWEIQRLTDKQMWLKTNYNGKEYYTKFKKLKDF